MSRGINRDRPRAAVAAGLLVPGFVVRIGFAVVAAVLCIDRVPAGFWLVVALAGVAVAVIVPRSLAAWAVLAGLALDQLLGPRASAGAEFALLVAGMHLLHLLAAQMLVVPGLALVQVAVFRPVLLRFVVIQVPVQGAALLALTAVSRGDGGVVPALGVLGGIAVVVLAVVLAAPLLRDREEN